MSAEVSALFAAIVLGIVQLMVATQAATNQRGIKWNMSSRENDVPQLTGVAGRLDRASRNFLETFPFFVAAVVVIELSGRHSALSVLGAQTYVVARLAYVPVYAAGIVGLRSLIWLASLGGLALMLASPLFYQTI